MENDESIETERLLLRPPVAGDAKAIAELADNWNIAKNLGSMPYPYSISDAEEWICRQNRQRGINGFNFSIELKDQKHGAIGIVSIFNLIKVEAELVYWLGEDYWGRGIMSEAVGAVRDFAFGKLNAPFIVSHHLLDNPASGRVAEKCGLKEVDLRMVWARARRKFAPGRTLRLERIDWERLGAL